MKIGVTLTQYPFAKRKPQPYSSSLILVTQSIFRVCILCCFTILNLFLGGFCEYDNQTFYANQSIITFDCSKRCQCHHIDGKKIMTCKPLCRIEEDLKCHPLSERISEFKNNLNETNCTCTHKKCISGINISQ